MFVAYAVLAYAMTLYAVTYAMSLIHQMQRAALILHSQAL